MSTPTSPAATPHTLADYTAPAFLVPRLQGCTIPAVMDELSQVLHHADHPMPDLRSDSRAALQRELLTGVDLSYGTVFPRVRVSGIPRPRFALGRTAEPLQWLAKCYPPTELVFLLAEPATSTPESEQLVETLSRLRRGQAVLGELRLARGAEEMLLLLQRVPLVNPEELATVQARPLQRVNYYAGSGSARGPTRRR